MRGAVCLVLHYVKQAILEILHKSIDKTQSG